MLTKLFTKLHKPLHTPYTTLQIPQNFTQLYDKYKHIHHFTTLYKTIQNCTHTIHNYTQLLADLKKKSYNILQRATLTQISTKLYNALQHFAALYTTLHNF